MPNDQEQSLTEEKMHQLVKDIAAGNVKIVYELDDSGSDQESSDDENESHEEIAQVKANTFRVNNEGLSGLINAAFFYTAYNVIVPAVMAAEAVMTAAAPVMAAVGDAVQGTILDRGPREPEGGVRTTISDTPPPTSSTPAAFEVSTASARTTILNLINSTAATIAKNFSSPPSSASLSPSSATSTIFVSGNHSTTKAPLIASPSESGVDHNWYAFFALAVVAIGCFYYWNRTRTARNNYVEPAVPSVVAANTGVIDVVVPMTEVVIGGGARNHGWADEVISVENMIRNKIQQAGAKRLTMDETDLGRSSNS